MTRTIKGSVIQQYMKSLDLTHEEAVELWNSDHSDKVHPEAAALGAKDKANGRRYEKSEKVVNKEPAKKERKVDEIKGHLLAMFKVLLEGTGDAEITAIKTETEISFSYKGDAYTLKLTRHRAQKE